MSNNLEKNGSLLEELRAGYTPRPSQKHVLPQLKFNVG